MKVVIGADHRGFELKEDLVTWLTESGYEVVDVGANVLNPEDDYFDFAQELAKQLKETDRGILFCGSGHGMDIVANRFEYIRGILGFRKEVVIQGREHEDANVLILPADWVSYEEVVEMVDLFLATDFSGEERHVRRLHKLESIH